MQGTLIRRHQTMILPSSSFTAGIRFLFWNAIVAFAKITLVIQSTKVYFGLFQLLHFYTISAWQGAGGVQTLWCAWWASTAVFQMSSEISIIWIILVLWRSDFDNEHSEFCSLNKAGPLILTPNYIPVDWNIWSNFPLQMNW